MSRVVAEISNKVLQVEKTPDEGEPLTVDEADVAGLT